MPKGHSDSEKDSDAPCTLEEIERAQKDLLERGLQVVKAKRYSGKPPLFTMTVLIGKLMSVSLCSLEVSADRWKTWASIC